MAQTQIVIVYSPNQNKRRSVIIPDDDSQIPIHIANLLKGEAFMVGLLSDYQAIGPDALLALHTGKSPASDRCIVHNGLMVQAVVLGDPLIDTHPLGTMALDTTDKAAIGLSVVNGVAVIPAPPINAVPAVGG